MRRGYQRMWSWGILSILGLFLVPLTVAAQGLTPASAHLEAAIGYYTDLEYERALEELSRAERRAESQDEQVAALLYQGIIHSEMNQSEAATAAFRAALQIQLAAVLPVKVAPKIAQLFEAQREQLQPLAIATDTPSVANAAQLDAPGLVPSRNAGIEVPIGSASPRASEVNESQPWFKRWYVWAAVGAVVTAATVGTVMATQDDSSRPLYTSDVCSGNCDVILGARSF